MKGTKAIDRKIRFLLNAIDKIAAPEIILENPAVQGRELQEPFVIICNHSRRGKGGPIATADGPMIRYAFNNRKICSLMAGDLMAKPLMNHVLEGLDCIPVNRTAASTDWIRVCREKLREGVSVVIFPEGTTIKEEEIDVFKPGFALLAKSAGVRVLPVAINGEYFPLRKGRLKIKIGTPRSLSEGPMSPGLLKKESERFRQIVGNMYYSMKPCEEEPDFLLQEDCEKEFVKV